MRSWIAEKLFDLAAWLHWDAVVLRSLEVVLFESRTEFMKAPKKKVGRPKGSKDKKPRKRPVRKVKS